MTVERPVLSIVIPVCNGEKSLPVLVPELVAQLRSSGWAFEIILVNDASSDGSWDAILQLRARFPQVRGVDLMFNTGQFRALLCGLAQVRGEIVVTMDDDLQHPPREVLKLVRALTDDPKIDAVIGCPDMRHHRRYRNIGSRFNDVILRMSLGKPRDLHFGSFRAIRRPVVDAMLSFGTTNPVPGPLLFKTTKRLRNVTVEHLPRSQGESNYSVYKLGKVALDNLLSYSTLPLKVVSGFGLATALVSASLGFVILVYRWLNPSRVLGWTSLALLIIFFSGLMLFSIGLIGEYLIRILTEVGRSPRYIIRERAE